MAMVLSQDDQAEARFQKKLIEILGNGFGDQEPHDFIRDIELARSLHRVLKRTEVEYFVVTAMLNLPCLIESSCFLNTLKEILTFYLKVLKTHMVSYASRMECLRAIEDCCLNSPHLKERQATAFIIHFFHQAKIIDTECVVEFFDQLAESESPLLQQDSLKMLIGWTRHEAIICPNAEEVNKPISYWLNHSTQCAALKPFYTWAKNYGDQYNPAFMHCLMNELTQYERDGRYVEGVQNQGANDVHEVENDYEVYDEDEPEPPGFYLYDEDDMNNPLMRHKPRNFMQAYKDYF